MSRAPVTIAILAWNSWDTTRACLDSLRPTLGVRDQVVVVDNGSTDGTPAGLRAYPWVEVVTNAENRGFAGGCNDGAARARHDIIIFLNNDTVLAHQWIDPLVEAFEDPSVGAAGPRSNFVSGEQVVGDAEYRTTAELRRFARRWAAEHRGQTVATARLVGFCLAVRRGLFEQLGGFDEGYGTGGFEDDDLCQRILKAGHQLVIRSDSFVHHEGHKTFDANGLDWFAEQESNRGRFVSTHGDRPDIGPGQLISACLIVKDEQDRLPDCLASLQGIADEIVVYDTGSTDGTVALARAHGATVVKGYWDDDFARARNAALEHCRGEWILWLDADETIHTDDARALRTLLVRTRPTVDAWSVRIHNLTGAGMGAEFTHHASRIFRRSRCEWTGRLHEQVARRGTHAPVEQADLEDVAWIRHTGYMNDAMAGRNKAERNVRVAQAEVDRADGWDPGFSLTSLGRSLLLAGRAEEGLARIVESLERTDNGITRRLAMRSAVEASLSLGRLDEALEWSRRLRAEGQDSNSADAMEATVRLARGEWDDALRLVSGVRPGVSDRDGFAPAAGAVAAQKAQALANLDRPGEAADALLAVLLDDGVLDAHLGALVEHSIAAGRPLRSIAAAVPSSLENLFLAQILQLQPGPADQMLEACIDSGINPTAVLATASTLARRLPLERALVWSSRLRAAGYGASCPLIAISVAPGPSVYRARAAAIAAGAFADQRGVDQFHLLHSAATDAEKQIIREEAAQLCPALLSGAAV